MISSYALADHLEIFGFEDDHLVFTDGSVGFALELSPLDLSPKSDEDRNGLKSKIVRFLNSLPSGIHVQFVQDIRGGHGPLIQDFLARGKDSVSPEASRLAEGRAAHFSEMDHRGELPLHGLKLFVRTHKEKPRGTSAIAALFKKIEIEPLLEDLRRETSKLFRIRENMLSELRSLGLAPQLVSPHDIATELYHQWNPGAKIELGKFRADDIRDSLLYTDVELEREGFLMGNRMFRVISLKLLPDATFIGMAEVLRSLPFGSRLFLSFFVPDQMTEIERLKTQRRIAFSMVHGKRTGVSDLESGAKLQELETLLQEMISSGEKIFYTQLNILLEGGSEEELDEKVSESLSVLRQFGSAEGMLETIASFPVFREIALPNARGVERRVRLKSSNLSDLLPLFGPWEGDKENPSLLFTTRMGSLVALDPFSKRLTNFNQLISGGSGVGKSFLTNLIVFQMLKENPKVYFVDIGGSYQKLCENLGGEYLPLGLDGKFSINPFDLLPGQTKPTDQKIKFLVGLIELMTKEENEGRLPRLERSELEEAILEVFDTKTKPKLSDLKEALLCRPGVEMRRLGRILSAWCGDTAYGRLLDRETNMNLRSSIVAFDLKGMDSIPDLQSVFLFVITDFVWREVQKSRGEKKFLIFDECWKLLKNESGIQFIEEVFRTFRKYNASAIAISQDIDDFAKSKISGAILPNCSTKWVLVQNKSDPARLKEVLQLNENEVALVQSLTHEKGVYSETFLSSQDDRSVIVLSAATPLEYWIATTDPKDLAALEKEMKEAPESTQIERLIKLAQKYPEGLSRKASGGNS
jgi:conjugal transfer ATP-binding protein TraC